MDKDLRVSFKELSELVMDYTNIITDNSNLIFTARSDDSAIKRIFVSDLGMDLQKRIDEINRFWTSVFSHKSVFNMISIGFTSLFGNLIKKNDKGHETNANESEQMDFDEQINIILSMSILMISGMVDDYLTNLRDIVFNKLIANGKTKEAIK